MKKLLVIFLLLLSSACALPGTFHVPNNRPTINRVVEEEMNKLYSPWQESAFCVAPDTLSGNLSLSAVYNVEQGGWMSVSNVPICLKGDIMFHTHPWWAEKWSNFIDEAEWEYQYKTTGNIWYGIMFGEDWYTIYEINK